MTKYMKQFCCCFNFDHNYKIVRNLQFKYEAFYILIYWLVVLESYDFNALVLKAISSNLNRMI